jgi:hypothetical protein
MVRGGAVGGDGFEHMGGDIRTAIAIGMSLYRAALISD